MKKSQSQKLSLPPNPQGGLKCNCGLRIMDYGFKEFPEKYKNPKSTTEPKASSAKPIRNPKYAKSALGDLGVSDQERSYETASSYQNL